MIITDRFLLLFCELRKAKRCGRNQLSLHFVHGDPGASCSCLNQQPWDHEQLPAISALLGDSLGTVVFPKVSALGFTVLSCHLESSTHVAAR